MALTLKQVRDRMVPASSKAGSNIDSQWLSPASHDKKMVDAMTGDKEEVFDKTDLNDKSQNFKAQDMVKKNTKAPLRETQYGTAEATAPISDAVYEAYEDEALSLLEEVMDLVEQTENVPAGYFWKDIVNNLKCIRDCLIPLVIQESVEVIDESFKAGSFKLKDGNKVKLTKEDVDALNIAVSGTTNHAKLMNEITKNQSEFNSFLTFSKSLKEDYDSTIVDILSETTQTDLQYIVDNDLNEGDIWAHAKGGAKVGSVVGKHVGSIVGQAGGAMYGGTIGASIGAAKTAAKYRKLVKNWNDKKEITEEPTIPNHNNKKKSVVGTAAPALDSDPNVGRKKSVFESALNRIMGNPRPLSSSERNQRDLQDHKFSSTQGGDSSNYKDKDLKKDKKD